MDEESLTVFAADDPTAKRLAALWEITRAIAASLDVSSIFDVVSQLARNVLPHDSMVILLLHSEPDVPADPHLAVAFCHVRQPAGATVEAGRWSPPSGFSFGPVLLASQPVVLVDLATTAAEHPGDQILLAVGRAALMVPICVPPRVLGGLVLISRTPGAFSTADVPLVEPIASLLAVALEHQRLCQQSNALALAEERNRLAREIHDVLAQSLGDIIMNLESLKPYHTVRSRAAAVTLSETEALARDALEEARRSILRLCPTSLEHQSLRDALTQELAGLARRAGLATQFYIHGEERPLAPDQATALFRVAQEAFQNIHKHAAARNVILGLAYEVEAILLIVEDDGVGFVPETRAPDERGGFGLLSMAARVHSLGGELQVTSHPKHGTAVRATLPYLRPRPATAAVVLDSETPATQTPQVRPVRVLIADDHTTTRQGIQRILDGHPDIQVIAETSDGLAAVEQTAHLRPDVVLLDVQMPRLSGIEALPRLRAAHPGVEVVMLTMFDHDEQVFASLEAGARGYVLKDAPPETLVAAVRAASHGQSLLPPSVATRVVDRFTVLARRGVDPDALTVREREILECMAGGLRYKEIAAHLNITTKTVQYHVTNILQKLHVKSRGEAVAAAMERGLICRTK